MLGTPFCGKGTIPVEACLQGRNGFGVDISPEAFAATLDAEVYACTPREGEEYVVQASKKVQKAFAQSDRPPVSDDVALSSFTRERSRSWSFGRGKYLARTIRMRPLA